jgi:xanthine dehydrogenase YagS FAD-binding subunit
MRTFAFEVPASVAEACRRVADRPGATFFAGGTTLMDLQKLGVVEPEVLVDVTRLPLDRISDAPGLLRVGATVRNSDLAAHPLVRERFPVLSQALLAGASAQLRNMATLGGNLLQRTRCPYFRDVHAACNKRVPGSGCDAIGGYDRGHAVLGASEHCAAVFPSDACTALAILDADVHTRRADGSTRRIPFMDLHLAPGATPHRETVLEPGELVTHLDLFDLPAARRSAYLKVRDRASYEFALASAAVLLDTSDGTPHGAVVAARVALGGVATRPWRSPAAEQVLLSGGPPTATLFADAADAALTDAVPLRDNGYKIELARRTLVRALTGVVWNLGRAR